MTLPQALLCCFAAGHADEEDEEEDQELDLDDPDLLRDDPDGDSDENLDNSDDVDAEDDPAQAEPDDDGMGIFRQALHQSSHPAAEAAAAAAAGGVLDQGPDADAQGIAGMSKHERQQQRMQERITKLEAQNMAEKDWFMQGEAGAGPAAISLFAGLDR